MKRRVLVSLVLGGAVALAGAIGILESGAADRYGCRSGWWNCGAPGRRSHHRPPSPETGIPASVPACRKI